MVALVLLAAGSGWLSLASTIRLERLFHDVATERFNTSQGALALENTLLEQQGLMTRALIPETKVEALMELRWRRRNWQPALEKVSSITSREDERLLLARADSAYRSLVAAQDVAIAAIEAGDLQTARKQILQEVQPISRQTHGLCEQVVLAQGAHIQMALDDARKQVMAAAFTVFVGVGLTLVAGSLIIVMLLRRVIRPIRRMASEAADSMSKADARAANGHESTDEIAELGRLVESIRQNAASARQSLLTSEDRREQAEAAGKLAACVAHEVRTPLQTMSIALRSFRREVGENPVLLERCEMFRLEIDRLEGIVREFLEFARPPQLNIDSVELDRVIARSLALLDERLLERGVRVERHAPSTPVTVKGDSAQLQQVVQNLITNSIRAMPQGGVIRISEGLESDQDRAVAVVRLSDEGEGVPVSIRDRLFEPFATSRKDGTGLGLAISASIVKRHGGSLELESTGSAGTTFALRLPVQVA